MISFWSSRSGSRSDSRTRSAVSAASCALTTSSSRMANSSPPKRAAVSVARMLVARRSATSRRTSSPAAWPRLSLIVLKSSRSRKMTAMPCCSRRLRATAWRTRSTNRARLARLVTGSWKAWWASCSSKALRSLTSRLLRTIPRTASSSSRFVCRTSNWRSVPSLWRSEHSRTSVSLPAYARAVGQQAQQAAVLVGGQQAVEAGADHVLRGVAEDALDRRALVDDGGVGVEHGDEVAGVLDERAEARLALAAVDLLGQRRALERKRDLRGQRAQRALQRAAQRTRGRRRAADDEQAARVAAQA